jgi:hypothetical protein
MLSIIVASNRDENFIKIAENIAATVGVMHEVIRLKEVSKGLCEAYNRGASLANYPCLCFVHDDVLFHTQDWGAKLMIHLSDQRAGVVGVMGGRYKAAAGLGWRDGKTSFYRYNMKDGLNGGKQLRFNPANEIRSEVICLDGAFLCCRKDLWQQFRFDQVHFTGFHFYDIDFTFRVAKRYHNYVVDDILLEHFSHGSLNKAFLSASLRFDQLHGKSLPATLDTVSEKEQKQLEGYMLAEKLYFLKKNNFSFFLRLKLLKDYFFRYGNAYQLVRNFYVGFLKS